MDIKNRNNGFAILEILLLIVTLFFISAIAWVVMHHSKDSNYKTIVKTGKANYIEITEWHVKLTVPDATQKISYELVDKDHPNDVIISSEVLNKFAADHKECSTANQFVYISRVKEGESWHGLPWSQAKEELIKNKAKNLGLYYYYDGARPTISPCVGTNIDDVQKLNNQAYDLYDQLPSYQNIVINL
jgi:glycerol-3-phosphate cytidylyltransferase-like family protein